MRDRLRGLLPSWFGSNSDNGEPPSPRFVLTPREIRYVAPMNKFGLDPGQWTDDASMGLCLADSLLHSAADRCQDGALDGSDLR